MKIFLLSVVLTCAATGSVPALACADHAMFDHHDLIAMYKIAFRKPASRDENDEAAAREAYRARMADARSRYFSRLKVRPASEPDTAQKQQAEAQADVLEADAVSD
ncbi:MAG: hypothetical protein AAGI24_02910 [Pseudomonadota bacterium]